MIRRNPTRIELKLEDISEYNALRHGGENGKERTSPQSIPPWSYQILLSRNANIVHERIGFVPQPRAPS